MTVLESVETDIEIRKWGDSYVIVLNRSLRKLLDVKEGNICHAVLTKKA